MTRNFCTQKYDIKPVAEQIENMKKNPVFAKNFSEIEEMMKTLRETDGLSPVIPTPSITTSSQKPGDNELDNRKQSVYG